MADAIDPRVDGSRLWESLMEMARIGASPNGGSSRLTLTDDDREGRDLFYSWCVDAGCTVDVDKAGNMFARRSGEDDSLPALVIGSHLDTQPMGGRFDGVFGVLAGLEVVRALNDADVRTERPIEVANWTNEEGSRFAPAMLGSGVYAGVFTLEEMLAKTDAGGATMGEELERIGYAGDKEPGSRAIAAYLEAHIEQGPILESAATAIGVVQGAQAQRWFEIDLKGQSSHAGTTPIDRRRDALLGAARIVEEVRRIGVSAGPDGRSTVGMFEVGPNSRNVVPGNVFMTVDMRFPDDGVLAGMGAELRESAAGIAREAGLELDLREIWHTPPIVFDPVVVEQVQRAAEKLGVSSMPINSGAGHDACYIAKVAPTAMVFVPCANGLSHNESEYAAPADLAAGAGVLLQAALALAGRA